MSIQFGKTGRPDSHRLSEGGVSRPGGFNPWYPEFSYFEFDGTGDRLESPDTADLDTISGDLEIHAEISNWSDTGASQFIYGRWNTSHAFFVGIANGGGLLFFTRDSSGTYRSVTSAEALPEEHIQVRVVFDRSATTVDMYYKRPYTPWIPLTGGTMDLSGNVIRVGSDEMSAGAQGSGSEPFTGRIHQARVWKNIVGSGDEVEMAAWTAADYVAGTTFTSGTDTPRVWTLFEDAVHYTQPVVSGSFEDLLNQASFAMLASQHQGGVLDDPDAYRGAPYLGATADTSDTNDPTLMPHTGENYWYRPAVQNNRLYAADTAVLDVTGDLDLTIDVAMDDWTATNQSMLCKSNTTGNQRSWQWYITASTIRFMMSVDGTAETVTQVPMSSMSGGVPSARERHQLRVKYTASTGNVQFYELLSGVWTQIDTDRGPGPLSIFSSSADLEIGSRNGGAGFLSGAGKFYDAKMYNGHLDASGTLVAHFDPADTGAGGASWTGTADGLSWVVGYAQATTTAMTLDNMLFVDRPCWWFGLDDFVTIPVGDMPPLTSSDSFTMFVAMNPTAHDTYGNILTFREEGVSNAGFQVQFNVVSDDIYSQINDGTNSAASGFSENFAVRGWGSVAALVDTSDVSAWSSKSGASSGSSRSAVTGDASQVAQARVFSRYTGTTDSIQGGVAAVLAWPRKLSDAELDVLQAELGS